MRYFIIKYVLTVCISTEHVLGTGIDRILITDEMMQIKDLSNILPSVGEYLINEMTDIEDSNPKLESCSVSAKSGIKKTVGEGVSPQATPRNTEKEDGTLDGLDSILEKDPKWADSRNLLKSIEEFSDEPLSMKFYLPEEDYRSINPKACSFMVIGKMDHIKYRYIQNVLRMAPNYSCSHSYKKFKHRDATALDNIESYSVEMRVLEANNQMKKFYSKVREVRQKLLKPQLTMSAVNDFETVTQIYFAYISRQVAKFSDVLEGFAYDKKSLSALQERREALSLIHPINEVKRQQKQYVMKNKRIFYPEIEHMAFAKASMVNTIFQIEEIMPYIEDIYAIIKQEDNNEPAQLNYIREHMPELTKSLQKSLQSILDFNPDSFDNVMLTNAKVKMEETLKIFTPMVHMATRSLIEISVLLKNAVYFKPRNLQFIPENAAASTKTTPSQLNNIAPSTKTTPSQLNNIAPSTKTTPSQLNNIAPSTKTTPSQLSDTTPSTKTTPSQLNNIVPSTKTTPSLPNNIVPSTKTTPSLPNNIASSTKTTPSLPNNIVPSTKTTPSQLSDTTPSTETTPSQLNNIAPSTKTTPSQLNNIASSTENYISKINKMLNVSAMLYPKPSEESSRPGNTSLQITRNPKKQKKLDEIVEQRNGSKVGSNLNTSTSTHTPPKTGVKKEKSTSKGKYNF
ncbi:hypothetical protein NERG_01134 [Nematocida ausubeli]|uniref:Uncharacterized protein n=1 Tax=Nematocida ausubeli (strain ATCC PRA-371 / ERTm2) TaxID=1913371 RepID=H8ZCY7_NEMA1|nr:hypothetical protein NERG_01134 [Nematocida ausubeli]